MSTAARDPNPSFDRRWKTPTELPLGRVCRVLSIPDDIAFFGAINEMLSRLGYDRVWDDSEGGVTADEASSLMSEMMADYIGSRCGVLGSIISIATADPPDNTLLCDGSTHLRIAYPALYNVLHADFIVDEDTFVTPDLRNRFMFGHNAANPGYPLHAGGGYELTYLTTAQMPSHGHLLTPHTHETVPHSHAEGIALPVPLGAGGVAGAVPSVGATGLSGVTVLENAWAETGYVGQDEPHSNMPPHAVMRFVVVAR